MRISVIIPTYNESSGIAETIGRAYAQTRKPDEVLVVDDSTDSTPQIVSSLAKKYKRLRLIRGIRKGVSAARNLGAREAKGDIIVFLDADVLLGKDCLEKAEAKFREKGVELVHWFNPPQKPRTFMEKCNYVRIRHLSGRAAGEIIEAPHAYLRTTFQRLGGFNESLRYFEDREIYDRIRKAGLQVHKVDAIAEHAEPGSFGDFYKQASWLGRSLSPSLMRWRIRALFYPLGPVYWLAFLLSLLLSAFYQPALYALAVLVFIMLVELARCIWLTGMVLPSLCYMPLSLLRQFVVAFSLLRKIAAR
ncbi:MAG: glycosyltransferase [Candidatus Micrarchaeia archaeon]|jgi:glycosyltransferase involved in cell wall biosynthesis